jgi:hypothetical protein
MRNLPAVWTATTIGLTATWVAAAAPGPEELPRYVLTDREAFVLQEPALVSAPPVQTAQWSGDGRFVLVVRQLPERKGQPIPSELSLQLWSRRTGRLQELWKRPPGLQHVEQIAWLPGTATALVPLAWIQTTGDMPAIKQTLLRVDAARGQVQALGAIASEALAPSPAQPLALLVGREQPTLRVVRAEGPIGPAVRLPEQLSISQWSPDGTTAYAQSFARPPLPGQPIAWQWQAIDARTGAVTLLPGPPAEVFHPRELPILLKPTVSLLKEQSTSQRVRPLWLEGVGKSEHPRLLVCPDAEWSSLAPNGSGLLYLSQGALWAAPVERTDRGQLLAQVEAAGREEAMARAKQIGLGFAMYAQDYDGVFPPAGAAVTDQVRPYVKNDEVFLSPGDGTPGFVYMLDAVAESTFKDPSTTVLGYLTASGGRAVIYVDGHVEWKRGEAN